MITPRFEVRQDADFVIVAIHAPYVKATEAEFTIGADQFHCYVKPYYLRLTFPGQVVEDGREKAAYDAATGELLVHIPKAVPGEHFPDLDLLTTLLARKPAAPSGRANVEVLGGSTDATDTDDPTTWTLAQEAQQPPAAPPATQVGIGFNGGYHNFFAPLQQELSAIVDVPDPDTADWASRRHARLAQEDAQFNEDHYIADYMDDGTIQALMAYITQWQRLQTEHADASLPVPAVSTSVARPAAASARSPSSRRSPPARAKPKTASVASDPGSPAATASFLTQLPPTLSPTGPFTFNPIPPALAPALKTPERRVDTTSLTDSAMEAAAASLSIVALVEPEPARPLIVPLDASPASARVDSGGSGVTLLPAPPEPAVDPRPASPPASASAPVPVPPASVEPTASVSTFQLAAVPSFQSVAAPSIQPAVRFGAAPDRPTYRFTDDEKMQLMNLPKREYLVADPRPLYLGLVDLLFAYAYDDRTTEGERNAESAWTMCKLSATLSALEVFASVPEVVTSCLRRSLAFPLYRHWGLSVQVLADVVAILRCGRRAAVACLLSMRRTLDRDEYKHYLSRLYLDDYCVWLQTASERAVLDLAGELATHRPRKADIGWPLALLETAARAAANDDDANTAPPSM